MFIHNPHSRGNQQGGRMETGAESDISLLNINQSISSVAAGRLDYQQSNEILLVGTQTNLLAYDIDNNSDIFYKDVSYYLHVNLSIVHTH